MPLTKALLYPHIYRYPYTYTFENKIYTHKFVTYDWRILCNNLHNELKIFDIITNESSRKHSSYCNFRKLPIRAYYGKRSLGLIETLEIEQQLIQKYFPHKVEYKLNNFLVRDTSHLVNFKNKIYQIYNNHINDFIFGRELFEYEDYITGIYYMLPKASNKSTFILHNHYWVFYFRSEDDALVFKLTF